MSKDCPQPRKAAPKAKSAARRPPQKRSANVVEAEADTVWALTIGDEDNEGYQRVGKKVLDLSSCAVSISKPGLSQKEQRRLKRDTTSTVWNYFQALDQDTNEHQASGDANTEQHDICKAPAHDWGESAPMSPSRPGCGSTGYIGRRWTGGLHPRDPTSRV